ncbi:uncharacterized protein FTOL_08590 [Fusarium torulosum]|uniref:Uncharacterized protein n=1 Tax=Fusarium torulosum TaxID=33205 RepID=A0AAE8SK41_9HYPO|nr:uncharacterized protein FTOL_08590 [Fusarium torulosum]
MDVPIRLEECLIELVAKGWAADRNSPAAAKPRWSYNHVCARRTFAKSSISGAYSHFVQGPDGLTFFASAHLHHWDVKVSFSNCAGQSEDVAYGMFVVKSFDRLLYDSQA